jgi:membrane-bound lytic murein transglycosylase D
MEESVPMIRLDTLRFAVAALAATLFAGCATPPPAQDASGTASPFPVVAASTPPSGAPSAPADVAVVPAEAAASAPAPVDDGAAAAPPVDPLRPEVIIDPDDATARSDLWARVRRGFAMEDLDTPLVRQHERYYASRPDYVARMTERATLYLFHIVEEVERRGLPTELALLPFIESAFNPQAMSVARASGMWQFIPSTGRIYDLTQNAFRDDRRDVLASTRAALDYLTRLHGMFGDWQLALAAYNWGEGSVQRAIARNRRTGKPTDYSSLRMPAETRSYVPKLQAMKNIIAQPDVFAITLPPIQNHPYFLSVPVERDIDVPLAAKLAGLDLDEFMALNPQLNRPLILAAGTPQVLLPYDNANQFVRAVNAHKGPLASWTAWVAPRTMRPSEVAKVVGMDEDELREVNHIPARMLVRTGSTLLVPRTSRLTEDIDEHIADHAMIAFAPDAPPARRVSIKAGKGGVSVAAVARRYRVSAAQVASWNGVSPNARFRAGESIVVYMPQKARAKAKAATATRPSKAVKAHARAD